MLSGIKILSFILIISGILLIGCEVKEAEPPLLTIEYTVNNVSFYNGNDGSIDLIVTGGVLPYTYLWSNGSDSEDLDSLTAGIYSVTVNDAVDSAATDTIIVYQPDPDTVIYDIDSNQYAIVMIGNQTWMAENLRVTKSPDGIPVTSYCYNDNADNAQTYGRLYTWDVAMNGSLVEMAQGICPSGWHMPSDEEVKILEMSLGMTREEADMDNTWRGEGVGTSLKNGGESGFNSMLSGIRKSSGSYMLLDQYEYFWTSTEYGDNAWRRCLRSNDAGVGRWNTFPKTYGMSVRCIKNSND